MKLWITIISATIPASALITALLLLLLCRRRRRKQLLIIPHTQTSTRLSEPPTKFKFDSLRFHHLHTHSPPPLEPSFRWDDHPRLVAEAVENGWQSFAFSNDISRPPESGWELPAGSSELMQAVWLNPSLRKSVDDPSFFWARTSLPLPGPALGRGSFPQESYFEITIVWLKKPFSSASNRGKDRESDRAKLIRDDSFGVSSASLNSNFAVEEKSCIALGLTNIATQAIKTMPGTYRGSIGFHSDGSIFLDERKLVFESEAAEWADVNKVIGCGYEPSKNKVFFTVDSRVSHVIRCNSEVYSSPLFPFLAANVETKLLVNLGQAPFKYAPANATRTPNPCFFRPIEEGGDQKIGSVVDSRELFSVGRIETEWNGYGGRRKNRNGSISKRSIGSSDDIPELESDLFEIVLQG